MKELLTAYISKIIVVLFAVIVSGCAEGNFELSSESRLPEWFEIPKGMTRQDISVTMDTYLVPTEKSIFKLYDKTGKKLSVVKGKRFGGYLYPKKLKNPPPDFPEGYPSYEVIIADGIIDIIEHRKQQPIFFTTDDPAVWEELVPNTK